MTRVVWANLNPEADARGSWDQGIVEELTAGYEHHEPPHIGDWRDNYSLPWNPRDDGAVVVIPGQHNIHPFYVDALVGMIQSLAWSLVIVTSDEEAAFPIELLPTGPNYEVWTQYHSREGAVRVIPIGLPPSLKVKSHERFWDDTRDLDVFFAGQNTHARREELIDVMKDMACESGNGNISWVASTGFRAGLERDDYLACMARTRVAPCPSGYHSLDSFRLYEAIAAGALPVIESETPDGPEPDFWVEMFGWGCEIPLVRAWRQLPGMMKAQGWDSPEGWRTKRDEVQRWYTDYRASLAADFAATIARLQS